MNNRRWTCIFKINSSKQIKKVMWLCTMGRQILTNQRTYLIPQHLTCYDHSEMPEQSLLSMYFCIIAYQKCLTWLCSQKAASNFESNDCIYCVLSAHSEAQVFSSFSYFSFVIYSASLSGSEHCALVDSLDGNCACWQYFMRYYNFAHKLNSQLWMETWLLS